MKRYASEPCSQKRYTRRIPISLAKSLVVGCERTHRQALHDIFTNKVGGVVDKELLHAEIRYFCKRLDMQSIRALLPLRSSRDNEIVYMAMEAACIVGDPSMVPMIGDPSGKTLLWKLTAKYQHWDVLDVLLPGDLTRWNGYCMVWLASLSVPAIHYFGSRGADLPFSTYLLREVIIACYYNGFDRELLDLAFQLDSTGDSRSPEALVTLLTIPFGTTHPSAPETLEYVLGKYPRFKLIPECYDQIVQFPEMHPPEIREALRKVLLSPASLS